MKSFAVAIVNYIIKHDFERKKKYHLGENLSRLIIGRKKEEEDVISPY